MTTGTVRLEGLHHVTGRPKEALKNVIKTGNAPWDDSEFPEGQRRQYSTVHALGLVIAEALMAQGCTIQLAGEFVRAHALAIKLFLDEVSAGQSITPRFVLAMQRAVWDSWTGSTWEPVILVGTGTAQEVADAYAGALNAVGSERETRGGRSDRRIIGGPWAATVSIPEMYRLLRQRAEAKGYIVDGRNIHKIAAEDGDEAE
ncbi:hypothetical protein [Paracoccus sp. N5]|uniref:hypothetical protein n=1 Tax=Paracoccus sp. N5 TaxID=1101189 RepID=UPI00035E01E1|nr:hypothetical protein [Paracoccus sp. N5]